MKCLECKGEKGLCADGDEGTSTDCNEFKSTHCIHMTVSGTGIIHRFCNKGSNSKNGCAELKEGDGHKVCPSGLIQILS